MWKFFTNKVAKHQDGSSSRSWIGTFCDVCRGTPSPLVVYWNLGVSGKSQNNLWRRVSYRQNLDSKWLTCFWSKLPGTVFASARMSLFFGERKGRCHNPGKVSVEKSDASRRRVNEALMLWRWQQIGCRTLLAIRAQLCPRFELHEAWGSRFRGCSLGKPEPAFCPTFAADVGRSDAHASNFNEARRQPVSWWFIVKAGPAPFQSCLDVRR